MVRMFRAAARGRGQAGDAIVEVIIAVAVISSILTGAFFVVTRSSRGIRDAEEHAQALQLLQGQVELVRNAAMKPGGLPAALGTPFCLTTTGYYLASNPQCTVNSLYRLSIQAPGSAPGATTTFNLTVTWPSVNGSTDKVDLFYNVEVS